MGARSKGDARLYWVAYASGALFSLPFIFAFGCMAGGTSYGFYAAATAVGCYAVAAWLYARR
jgi:hypothetical protein